MFLQSTDAQELASRSADMLHLIDSWRLEANRQLDPRRKVELGQFLTPMPVAQLMASMLECHEPAISLLDPCAGVGSLFAACIAELCQRSQRPHNIHVTAYELDPTLAAYLPETLRLCQQHCESAGIVLTGEIRQADFLESAVDIITTSLLALTPLHPINAIILNPPYRKLQTKSRQWTLLQRAGIKTTNLYTGFLALCMRLLATNGEMIAITPRSFCNGRGLDPLVAKGLTAFLNSTFVDIYFRLFNGHTQVNATDLRHMRYPTRGQLAELATRLPEGKLSQIMTC